MISYRRRLEPKRIRIIRRAITNVAAEVGVAGGEAEGVLAHPAADGWIVPPLVIVLQPGQLVEIAAGVAEDGVKVRV